MIKVFIKSDLPCLSHPASEIHLCKNFEAKEGMGLFLRGYGIRLISKAYALTCILIVPVGRYIYTCTQ